MAVKTLTEKDFEGTIASSTLPVLVDFYADWCGPCKVIAPLMEEIAAEQEGKVLVCKVDVDKNQGLASSYQIMSIPSVISFKGGTLYKRVVGTVPKDELLKLIV